MEANVPKVGHGPSMGHKEFDCALVSVVFTFISLVFHSLYIKSVGHRSITVVARRSKFLILPFAFSKSCNSKLNNRWSHWIRHFFLGSRQYARNVVPWERKKIRFLGRIVNAKRDQKRTGNQDPRSLKRGNSFLAHVSQKQTRSCNVVSWNAFLRFHGFVRVFDRLNELRLV